MNPQSASVIIAYTLAIGYMLISWILYVVEAKRSLCPKHNIKEDNWLNVWSNLSIALFQMCMILGLLHKTAGVCTDTYWMGTIIWIAANYALTNFQTRRLQYTFHSQFKSTSVESLGYPNKLFYGLYAFGTLLLSICVFYFPIYAYDVKDHGSYGCQIEFQSGFFATAGTLLAWLFVWDWIVLALYIHGVRKLRKVIRNGLDDDNVLKASYIVRKILFLTVFFEISTVINVVLFSFSNHPSVSTAMHLSDTFLSVIIVFLMRQHNDDWYRKCINTICCCLSKVLLVEKTKHLMRYHSVSPRDEDEERGNEKFVFGQDKEIVVPLSGVIAVDEEQRSNKNINASNKDKDSSSSNKSSRSKPSTDASSSVTKTNTESTKTSSNGTAETVSFEHHHIEGSDNIELLGSDKRILEK